MYAFFCLCNYCCALTEITSLVLTLGTELHSMSSVHHFLTLIIDSTKKTADTHVQRNSFLARMANRTPRAMPPKRLALSLFTKRTAPPQRDTNYLSPYYKRVRFLLKTERMYSAGGDLICNSVDSAVHRLRSASLSLDTSNKNYPISSVRRREGGRDATQLPTQPICSSFGQQTARRVQRHPLKTIPITNGYCIRHSYPPSKPQQQPTHQPPLPASLLPPSQPLTNPNTFFLFLFRRVKLKLKLTTLPHLCRVAILTRFYPPPHPLPAAHQPPHPFYFYLFFDG